MMMTTMKMTNSTVGIATRYEMDSSGIESWWWRNFLRPSRSALEPIQPPIQHVPSVKWSGRGVNHQRLTSAEVKERVELYIYSPLCLHGML